MNNFDDYYRARATATLTERHLLLHPCDYAGQLMAFIRGVDYRIDYAGPLMAFVDQDQRIAAQLG